jgi:hypothetical protein
MTLLQVLQVMREWQAEPLRRIRAALATAAPLREHTVDALDSLCTAWQQLLSTAVAQSAALCDREPLALSLRPETSSSSTTTAVAAADRGDNGDDDMQDDDEPAAAGTAAAAAAAASGTQPPCSLAGVPVVLRGSGVSLLLTSEGRHLASAHHTEGPQSPAALAGCIGLVQRALPLLHSFDALLRAELSGTSGGLTPRCPNASAAATLGDWVQELVDNCADQAVARGILDAAAPAVEAWANPAAAVAALVQQLHPQRAAAELWSQLNAATAAATAAAGAALQTEQGQQYSASSTVLSSQAMARAAAFAAMHTLQEL